MSDENTNPEAVNSENVQVSKGMNELAQREAVREDRLVEQTRQEEQKKKEAEMNNLMRALDKGVITKDEFASRMFEQQVYFKTELDRIEAMFAKAKAQGYGHIPGESNAESEQERMRKKFKGLAERGYL